MSIEKPKQYTPEEIAEFTKSRKKSDEELIKDHYSEYKTDGNSIILEVAPGTKSYARREMDSEFFERNCIESQRQIGQIGGVEYIKRFLEENKIKPGDRLFLGFKKEEGSHSRSSLACGFQEFDANKKRLTVSHLVWVRPAPRVAPDYEVLSGGSTSYDVNDIEYIVTGNYDIQHDYRDEVFRAMRNRS